MLEAPARVMRQEELKLKAVWTGHVSLDADDGTTRTRAHRILRRPRASSQLWEQIPPVFGTQDQHTTFSGASARKR